MSDRFEETVDIQDQTGVDKLQVKSVIARVVEGPDKGKEFTFRKRHNTIGTAEVCDFVLTDDTVSRHHLELFLNNNGIVIEDLGSKNGSFLGNMRLSEGTVTGAVKLRLGNTQLILEPTGSAFTIDMKRDPDFGDVLGTSAPMRELFQSLKRAAPHDVSILLEGETGTGKEMLAHAIHQQSGRNDKPFIVLDCSQLSQNILESELFGHVKGAFTGAHQNHKGFFEQADGGTLFIDEIGELPLATQATFLRAIEYGEFSPVGSTDKKKSDIRFIFATNRNLMKEVNQGGFRSDLFHRISVVHVKIPPLRQRGEDILLLAESLLAQHAEDQNLSLPLSDIKKIVQEHRLNLLKYGWPGNVRELKNRMHRILLKHNAPDMPVDPFSISFDESHFPDLEGICRQFIDADRPLKESKQDFVAAFEKTYLKMLLDKTEGNVSEAARSISMDRRNLQKLLQKYGL